MKDKLEQILLETKSALQTAAKPADVEELRVKVLGKKGTLTEILKQMGSVPVEEKPAMGKLVNETRTEIEALIASTKNSLQKAATEAALKAERFDVTLPGVVPSVGKRHPIMQILDEVKEIFLGMGFDVVEGPEVELDKYNFELLNIPKWHPARDTQDTFYINDNVVLRTQTSPMQARTMLSQKPPIRVIVPGRVYRSDAVDATHSPIFHQIEGLVVDKNIRMTDLKGTLEVFAKKLYGDESRVRFRPHHFRFTEPSAEMDATCFVCKGSGCRLCKGEGYIEILGCGMVHPKVLRDCGIDPDEYSGFAFGMGLDRMTMMRYGIDDLRLLFDPDMRFLSQF